MKQLLTFTFLLISTFSFSQTTVTPVLSADSLAQFLLGNNTSGIVITNPTLNCPGAAAGTYTTVGNNPYGINSGLLLTSGKVQGAFSQNTSPSFGQSNNAPGDLDLELIAGILTNDACIFEFDLFIPGDTVKFNYVFGSDEYNDFVGSATGGGVNDAFGFFISGPGITGSQNIAQVPGTTTGIAINNVNCGNNSTYYICNDPWNQTSGGCTNECPIDAASTQVEYDGFTTVLTAFAAVQPCNVYHLKLAIADASDFIYDSGVMIQAGSLTSNSVDISLTSLYNDPNGNPAAVEGCNFNPQFIIDLSSSLGGGGSPDTICFSITTSGTAIEGVDYEFLPDTICFYPGDTILVIDIIPISDGIAEGPETIILDVEALNADTSSACAVEGAMAEITLYDFPEIQASPDITICLGDTTQLSTTNAPNYSWSPPTGLSCTNCSDPLASPTQTTVYTVTSNIGSCSASDQVQVIVVEQIPVVASPDAAICIGNSTSIYVANPTLGYTYTWAPSNTLSSSIGETVIADPLTTTTYTVTATSNCYTFTDIIILTVNPLPNISLSSDQAICPEEEVALFADALNATTIEWSPSNGLSSSSVGNPIANPNQTTTYLVTITNSNGCIDTASVVVSVFVPGQILASINPTIIYYGESAQISTQYGTNFNWQPFTSLINPNTGNPIASPPESTTYFASALDSNGCLMYDTVSLIINKDSYIQIPNAFSPNGDGKNDIFRIKYKGIFTMKKFAVYDRWGKEVFSTSNQDLGWDGKIGGEDAEVGNYVYLLSGTDLSGKDILEQGNVTIIR